MSLEDGIIVPNGTDAPAPAPADPAPVDPAPVAPGDPAPADPGTDPAPAPVDPAPEVDGITYDKDLYDKGDVMTATVTLASQVKTIPATYHPSEGDPFSAPYKVRDALGTFEDGGENEWTYVEGSYTGTTAQFTATAR